MRTSWPPVRIRNGRTPYAGPGAPGADGSTTTPSTAENSVVPHGIATSMPWWKPCRPGQRGSGEYQGDALQPKPIITRWAPRNHGEVCQAWSSV
jgi:hypothetical protein